MFDEYIRKSNIIELVESGFEGDEAEDGAPSSGLDQATLKVLHEKRWVKLMIDLMREASEEEGFDLEPRKSFWWDAEAETAKFNWVVLIWGDMELAGAAVGDILSRRHEPKPAPPKSEDPRKRPTGRRRTLKTRRVEDMGGGTKLVTTTKLPHARVNRYGGDPHEVVKATPGGSRKVRATVSSGTEFAPQKAKEGGL